MTNVSRQIRPNIFEWKVIKLPENDFYQASECFFFQEQRLHLSLGRQGPDPGEYFKLFLISDKDFNPPIKIKLYFALTNECHESFIKRKKQVIWWYNTKTFYLIDETLPWTFRVIIEECLLKETQREKTSSGTSQNVIPPCCERNIHYKALSRDFSKLLEVNDSFDVTITCEGKTLHAHKIILQTRSEVLSAMLKSEMVEGKTGLIEIKGIKLQIFESFLQYLCSGILPVLNIDTAKELFKVGDQYSVEEMKKECSEFITKNLSQEHALDVLVLAEQHSDEDFRKKVMEYIIEKDIPKNNNSWSDFCKCHCMLANEVLNLYIKKH